jgi:hypothetical protein
VKPAVKPRSLFRHRDFLHLWTAETISQLGTAFLWVYFSPVRTLKHFPEPAID